MKGEQVFWPAHPSLLLKKKLKSSDAPCICCTVEVFQYLSSPFSVDFHIGSDLHVINTQSQWSNFNLIFPDLKITFFYQSALFIVQDVLDVFRFSASTDFDSNVIFCAIVWYDNVTFIVAITLEQNKWCCCRTPFDTFHRNIVSTRLKVLTNLFAELGVFPVVEKIRVSK